MGLKGAQWKVTEGGTRTFMAAYVNPKAKVWAAFVKTNPLLTMHDTTIYFERVLLIFVIMKNLSIDVGKLIA